MKLEKIKVKLGNHEIQALRASMEIWSVRSSDFIEHMPVEYELMREVAHKYRFEFTRTNPCLKMSLERSKGLALYRMLMCTELSEEHDVFRNSIAHSLEKQIVSCYGRLPLV